MCQKIEGFDNWLRFGERGASSEAIASYLSGLHIVPDLTKSWGQECKLLASAVERFKHTPYDVHDFSRCVELLKAVPEFKERFAEMKRVSPQWALLVDCWDELEKLYYTDTARCNERLRELRIG